MAPEPPKEMITIRSIRVSDAAELLALSQQTDRETAFMLIEPGERESTVEEERTRIERILLQENQAVFVAEQDGRLVGRISARGGEFQRNARSVHIVIGVLKAYWGQGIGTRLFEELERWGRAHRIHRLELSVNVDNERAIRLYKKVGFQIEGTKRDVLFVNGAFIDEYLMSKLLE